MNFFDFMADTCRQQAAAYRNERLNGLDFSRRWQDENTQTGPGNVAGMGAGSAAGAVCAGVWHQAMTDDYKDELCVECRQFGRHGISDRCKYCGESKYGNERADELETEDSEDEE